MLTIKNKCNGTTHKFYEMELELIVRKDLIGGEDKKMTFRKGDRVKRISGRNGGMNVGDEGVVASVGKTCVTISEYRGNHLFGSLELVKSSCCKKMDAETLKTFNKKNLVEGRKQAEKEKANYEAEESRRAYVGLINRKETQERAIKVANEELEEVEEDLKLFK